MVELALHGPVEVCLFSSLLGYFLSFPQGRSFCFSCWSRIGSSEESCLFIVVVEFLEYTLSLLFQNVSVGIVWSPLLHLDLFRLYYLYIFA